MRLASPRSAAFASLLLLAGACPGPDKGDSASDASTASTEASTAASTDEPTTGGSLAAECQQDSDCMLVNNCCECRARPLGAEVPACDGMCLQSTCEALQLEGIAVACRSGVCEFANVQCGEGPPACADPKPSCPPDTQTSIVGDCWGPCVPARYCEGLACTASSCGEGWLCAEHQVTPSTCAPIPRECDGAPTCSCAAPYLDEFCPGSCVESGGGLMCQDGG